MDALGWTYASAVDLAWQAPWSPSGGRGRPLIDKRTNKVWGYFKDTRRACFDFATVAATAYTSGAILEPTKALTLGNVQQTVTVNADTLENTVTVPDTCSGAQTYPNGYPYCEPIQYLSAFVLLHGYRPLWLTKNEINANYHFYEGADHVWRYVPPGTTPPPATNPNAGTVPGGVTNTGGDVLHLPDLTLPGLSLPDIKIGSLEIPSSYILLAGGALALVLLLDE